MASINQATKELHVKIVYYGPAESGKTTNLEQIRGNIQTSSPEGKGKIVTLSTNEDRTLFFDFYPFEATVIKGFTTKFQLFTVPGQVTHNKTLQLMLRGVDGIVFVADSQYEKMHENVESFRNMEENLQAINLSLDDIPYVIQYNKRDIPDAIAPVDFMEYLINNKEVQVPAYEAAATHCKGVFETLNAITRLLLQKFINQGNRR